MHIIFNNTVNTEQHVENEGYKAYYAGFSFKTQCCTNRKNYRPGIDTPCNAAGENTHTQACVPGKECVFGGNATHKVPPSRAASLAPRHIETHTLATTPGSLKPGALALAALVSITSLLLASR